MPIIEFHEIPSRCPIKDSIADISEDVKVQFEDDLDNFDTESEAVNANSPADPSKASLGQLKEREEGRKLQKAHPHIVTRYLQVS